MTLSEKLESIQHSSQVVHYEETFAFLSFKSSLNDLSLESLLECLQYLCAIPDRDRFSFSIIINENPISVNGTTTEDELLVRDHYRSHFNEGSNSFELEIHITKLLQNHRLSIFNLEKFIFFIQRSDLKRNLLNFSRHFEEYLIFEVHQNIDSFGSDRILFQPAAQENMSPLLEENRSQALSFMKDHANINGGDYNFLPSDFFLESRSDTEDVNSFFDSVCSTLSIFSFANNSEYCADNKIRFKLNGYRSVVTEETEFSALGEYVEFTYKIYKWIYGSGECSDKLGLVRNVLSLHLDENRNIKFNNQSFQAIESNHKIYLERNVENYMEIKNKMTELVLDASSKVYAMCDSFLDNFKNSIVTFVTFVLTVVIVSGISEGFVVKIFSPVFVYLIIVLSVLSLMWLFLSRRDAHKKYEQLCESTVDTLKANYHNLLVDGEVEDSVNPILEKNGAYLKKRINEYTLWWAALIAVFVISFILGLFIFTVPAVFKDAESKAKREMPAQERIISKQSTSKFVVGKVTPWRSDSLGNSYIHDKLRFQSNQEKTEDLSIKH